MTNIIVCSLPRTGTKSLCKALNILGYNSKHLPVTLYSRYINEGYNAFADTPCYSLSFVKERSFENCKFIYVDRNVDEWLDSFESVGLHKGYELLMNLTNPSHINQIRMMDMKSLGEIFGYHKKYDREHFKKKFFDHKIQMMEMLQDKLLIIDLKQGWEPLCSFLEKNIPEIIFPHLNKGKINDRID